MYSERYKNYVYVQNMPKKKWKRLEITNFHFQVWIIVLKMI